MNTSPLIYKRRNFNVSDADYAKLQELGKGNASKGLREALEYATANRMGEVPQPFGVSSMKIQDHTK